MSLMSGHAFKMEEDRATATAAARGTDNFLQCPQNRSKPPITLEKHAWPQQSVTARSLALGQDATFTSFTALGLRRTLACPDEHRRPSDGFLKDSLRSTDSDGS